MKKKYLKPEAEYISLEAEDIVTDDFGLGGDMSLGEGDGDLV
jgi:hypothetical protein